MRHVLFCLLFIRLAAAQTEHKLESHLLVPATQLQVYRAFTVDWQLRQWQHAQEVSMIPEPGGIWRTVDSDGKLQEGFCLEAIPGEKFVYSIVAGDTQTITITMSPVTAGCNIHILHLAHAPLTTPDDLQQLWAARLPQLRAYLTGLPAGYLAVPDGSTPHPAVLLLHDKFGVNRTIRALCDSLAAAGYVAAAVDMFKGELVTSVEQADRFVDIADTAESVAAAQRTLTYLRDLAAVQRNRIVIWGIGYGGMLAYEVAALDTKLRGVVSWYAAALPAPEKCEALTGPILAVFGDSDTERPRPEIERFNQSLVQAGVRAETIIVNGGSTFAEPQYGELYSTAATQEAWQRTLAFLDKRLKL